MSEEKIEKVKPDRVPSVRKTGVAWADQQVRCALCNSPGRRSRMSLYKQKSEHIERVGIVTKERYLCGPCAKEKGI